MRKAVIVLLLAGIVFACNQFQSDSISSPPPAGGAMKIKFCNTGSPDSLCSSLPIDVDTTFGVGYDSFLDSILQPPFDQFSWQTFIALNWPADANGRPIGNRINDYRTAPRVWETYTDPSQVFGSGTQELLLHLGTAKQENTKFFYMDSKAPLALLPIRGFREADGHPLIDRNLNFTLYEIKMNPVEVDFVRRNRLTTKVGIDSFWRKNNRNFELPQSDSASKNPGTIELKASWRILDPRKGDDTTRYYCRNALIYIDSAHTVHGKALVIRAKVGLVGLHIIRKTAKFGSMMIWSTFEHIDNTPDSPQEAQMDLQRKWSYYNPYCLNCVPNDTPALHQSDKKVYRWDSSAPYAKRYAIKAPSQPALGSFGTQAVRTYPIYNYTERMNQAWRNKLKGTVWYNYRLIGSQWQSGETFPADNAPAYLANTTLETYIQPTASCITCHSDARFAFGKDTIKTDMSFVFAFYPR